MDPIRTSGSTLTEPPGEAAPTVCPSRADSGDRRLYRSANGGASKGQVVGGTMAAVMTASGVLAVLSAIRAAGVTGWVDGGWGVDALLGRTTREHTDLDLVVLMPELDAARAVLADIGFRTVLRDWLPAALAVANSEGNEVDLHPITPDGSGGGHQELADGNRFYYPRPVAGRIDEIAVDCVDTATQVLAHQGYTPTAKDRADLRLLRSLIN